MFISKRTEGIITLVLSVGVVALSVYGGLVYAFSDAHPLKYGLDLSGGTELVYDIDTNEVQASDVSGRVSSLRNVIEDRVNELGVSEPIVFTQTSITGERARLIVQLPGVSDPEEAKKQIGKTPSLEFGLIQEQDIHSELPYTLIGLNGSNIRQATLQYNVGISGSIGNEPVVVVSFDTPGAKRFADITRNNIGSPLVIVLDGEIISTPVIRTVITGGVTQIEGGFSEEEAQSLVNDLNFGALPLPIALEGSSTVSPILGEKTIEQGGKALLIAFSILAILFVLVYRMLGVVSLITLFVYITLLFVVFKAFGVVFTASGLVGIGLSLGIAVDANVLVLERMREFLGKGKTFQEASEEAFDSAFTAIRDGNLSSLLIAGILYLFSSSVVKGFAFSFGFGIILSMVTAYLLHRFFISGLVFVWKKPPSFLFPQKKGI